MWFIPKFMLPFEGIKMAAEIYKSGKSNAEDGAMRSEGRNYDIFDHSTARMLKAAEEALETAKVDPSFWGVVREDRIQYFQNEVERWKRQVR